jgi:hypothetical protein
MLRLLTEWKQRRVGHGRFRSQPYIAKVWPTIAIAIVPSTTIINGQSNGPATTVNVI